MYHIPKPAEQRLPHGHNLLKGLVLPLLLLASMWLTRLVTLPAETAEPVWWAWGVLAILALLNCVVIIGMGILAHDAVHRVLFRHSFANEIIGGLLSALAFIPFHANRQFHLTHHSYAHQPDRDPEQVMHDRPFLLALTHGSAVALLLQYRILMGNLLHRMGDRRYRARVLSDLLLLGCAGLFYGILVPALGISLLHSLLPTVLLLPLVFGFRALSDHYGVPAVMRRSDAAADTNTGRDQPCGWVILTHPLIEWLWSHVNYHEVHHRFPWLSHAHLKAAFEATRDDYPYLVARGYGANLLRLARQPYYGRHHFPDADQGA